MLGQAVILPKKAFVNRSNMVFTPYFRYPTFGVMYSIAALRRVSIRAIYHISQ